MNKFQDPKQMLPLTMEGEYLGIQVSQDGRVWVCLDGQCVFRVKGLTDVKIMDDREDSDAPTI